MDKPTCGTCAHYHAHYVRFGRRYLELDEGHCVYPRLKDRKWDNPACMHYKPRPGTEAPGPPDR